MLEGVVKVVPEAVGQVGAVLALALVLGEDVLVVGALVLDREVVVEAEVAAEVEVAGAVDEDGAEELLYKDAGGKEAPLLLLPLPVETLPALTVDAALTAAPPCLTAPQTTALATVPIKDFLR